MRLIGAIGVMVLTLLAFHPTLATARDQGGGGNRSGGGHERSHSSGGGNVSNFSHGSGQGQRHGEHRGDWDRGHGYGYGGRWNPGYGYGYGYPGYGYGGYGYGGSSYSGAYPSQSYSVARPIDNPPAEGNFSGGPIRILNPANSGVTLNYTLNGTAYSIAPGSSQDFREDRAWVIEFSRGGDRGTARYQLQTGLYAFTSNNGAWDLFRQPVNDSGPGPAVAAPANPPAPNAAPPAPAPR